MGESVVFGQDTYVWLPDDEDAYVPAKVLGSFKQGEKGTVMNLTTNKAYPISVADSKRLLPMDEQSLQPLADMVELNQLDEPALLYNLKLRYDNDDIYTNIGSILVSINPFKKLNIYSPQIVDDFIQHGANPKINPPHIFAVADNAFKALIANRTSQSCIISGESGAGKTEATKLFLQYLAEKTSSGDKDAKHGASLLHEKILEANPLMEAFGNAKTVRNNNSSRFGKLIQVELDNKLGNIVGGNITSYLLEKSRLTFQASGERNYHVFYQLCDFATLDPEYNADLKLQDASQYFYTNPTDDPKGVKVDGLNDASEFENTLNAMEVLEFSKQDEVSMMKVLAGILNLGNVEFTVTNDASSVSDPSMPFLTEAARHLGLSANELGDRLIKRKVMDTYKNHSGDEAIAARDAFTRAIYGYLFDWIIAKTNDALAKQGSANKKNLSSIAVLDIFGFENFETGNLYQTLLINYTNSKLNSLFVEHVFVLEQELYMQEGIELQPINFANNAKELEVIEGKAGVLATLDEVNKMPKGDDMVFLTKVHELADGTFLLKPDVKAMRKKANQIIFSVNHYAGQVDYSVQNFVEQNRDKLLDDLKDIGVKSVFAFLSMLFKAADTSSNKKTISTQFKSQLNELITSLKATEPHYVRTIKPNSTKESDTFTAPMVLDQMRYAGLMEVCKIRKLGFPVRKDFAEFFFRYKPIAQTPCKDYTSLTVEFVRLGLFKLGDFEIGHTKVFMRDDQFQNIERRREVVLAEKVTKIQKVARGLIARQRTRKYKSIIAAVESAVKTRKIEAIEKALRDTGILPYVGKHLPSIQNAKKLLAVLKEEMRVLQLVESAFASRDLASLNSAIASAEELKLNDNPLVKDALALRARVMEEKSCLEALTTAVSKNDLPSLEKAIKSGLALELKDTNAFKEAQSAYKHLIEEMETVKALDAAIASKNATEIVKNLTRMAELGNVDHPSVKKGQEITKEIAKASAEAEQKMKNLKKLLQLAIERKDLQKLKELRPQVLQFGLQGELIDEANVVIAQLEDRSQKFNELSALKQAMEVKASSYDGINSDDVGKLNELIEIAVKAGFRRDDEELSAMQEFQTQMQSQVEAQSYLKEALASKDETKLRKALAMVADLGLETSIAREIEQEVQVLDNKKLEGQTEQRAKEKEELKKNLVEASEEARDSEKQQMLAEKTKAHQELIAKASDSSKYAFSKFYKIREDADYVEYIEDEGKSEFASRKLKYHSKVIPKSLLQFPPELSKTAIQVHKSILQYCGDLANPYPNTMARFMIVATLETPLLVDEVYLQLMKHLTDNHKAVSGDRAWGLLCMLTGSVPPTGEFAPFIVNFLLNHKSVKGLIGNYARLCLVQLDGRIRLGATKLLPDLDVIDTYSQRPPILAIVNRVGDGELPLEIPVSPDEDVDKVLQESVFPLLGIPDDRRLLYGIFVIDGAPESNSDIKTRLTRFYQKYNPSKMQHVEYFVKAWADNMEALFHKLEMKYGPEPSEEEIAEIMQKRGNGDKRNYLQLPITAAKTAAKRLGITGNQAKTPPAPQTSWPIPWWVHLGDVYLRMVKQNRIPIFTFKRKLFVNGEQISKELIEQARYDVQKGDLAITAESDVVELAAIHLTLRNKCKIPKTDKDMINLGLVDVLPVTWLTNTQPKEFIPMIKVALPKLEGASEKTLNEKYFGICRKQAGYGMSFFFLTRPGSPKSLAAGVDIKGIHLLNEERDQVLESFSYRKIKEYGASPTHFWMKTVEKETNAKSITVIEDTIYLSTIQAWDLYGLVYDYTYNAKELKLE